MHTTIEVNRLATFIGRTAAVTFLAAAGTLGLHAQQSAGTAPSLPPISLKSSLAAPLDLSTPDDLSYSSSIGSAEMANAENFSLSSSADQPPPRRRYGKPNYNDSRTNADGSPKYTIFVGGGFTLPVGGSHSYLATSYDIQAGAGRNFNKTFGVSRSIRLGQLRLPDRNPEQTAGHLQQSLATAGAVSLNSVAPATSGPLPSNRSSTSIVPTPSALTPSVASAFITRLPTSRSHPSGNTAIRSTDASTTRPIRPSTSTPATPSA